MQLQNYASGQWIAGSGKQSDLLDAITGDPAYLQAGSSAPLLPAASTSATLTNQRF
jgi:hypothetical protein